jgi:hypothetical protein
LALKLRLKPVVAAEDLTDFAITNDGVTLLPERENAVVNVLLQPRPRFKSLVVNFTTRVVEMNKCVLSSVTHDFISLLDLNTDRELPGFGLTASSECYQT